ncbi:lyase family protein [Enterococcus sp. AZ109]|uniref:lyase family protein n=1 Tax=Enterococcus sp. AZ109 TaxID=2774634 RepID=UPI003F273ADA
MMRIEQDSLGSIPIYQEAYYGIHSYRVKNNFQINQVPTDPQLIKEIARIKAATATANRKTGRLTRGKEIVICQAAQEIIEGKFDQEFLVEAIQGGAGSSTNMNVNEVIANRGLELLGHEKGDYHYLHPLEDVNCSQSTTEVYPSAGKLATLVYLEQLLIQMDHLVQELNTKAGVFSSIKKVGHTQLQDAIPTTYGASFAAFASKLEHCRLRIKETTHELTQLNLGTKALEDSRNTFLGYQEILYQELNQKVDWKITPNDTLVDETQNSNSLLIVSSNLKALAVSLLNFSRDLQSLASGTNGGLNERIFPNELADSSLIPVKINPVIPEVVTQLVFKVLGNDTTISLVAESGDLELNAFCPVLFQSLFESCQLLEQGCSIMTVHCIRNLQINPAKCEEDLTRYHWSNAQQKLS